MAATRNPLNDFVLTPQQQNLLFAALNSNKQQPSEGLPANNALNLSPTSYNDSPVQRSDASGFQESPFLDYDYEFNGDSSFDFDFGNGTQPKMIGDLPGTDDTSRADSDNNDSNDKRSHPDDEDDDDEESAKRRESGEKTAKKPGRKPLTTEPSSKRKAQNRAAQRAFRERKEKHLKDLETKVTELEKASEAANHENGLLRAQVDKMTVELNEYKKRVALMATGGPRATPQPQRTAFGQAVINNLNDVNFQFEFPKFGALPGPPQTNTNSLQNGRSSLSQSPNLNRSPSSQVSPNDRGKGSVSSASSHYTSGLDAQTKEDLAKFSGIFSPPLTNNNVSNASRSSLDSHYSAAATNTSSPSASSNSNGGPSSSCGTSPEPFTQSPMGFKPVDTMATIGEEQPSLTNNNNQDFGHFASIDINDINFLASQNNFQFDPQLFGDYREPQDNILGNSGLDDSFFNDAFDMDFTTPYNVAFNSPATQKKDLPAPKKDLIAQIDAAKEGDEETIGADGQLLTCNKIWEKLQNCPKVQNGDFDLDGLCSELQKKAKCSGSGAVVNEKDFKNVMQKYLGKTDKEMEECQGTKFTA